MNLKGYGDIDWGKNIDDQKSTVRAFFYVQQQSSFLVHKKSSNLCWLLKPSILMLEDGIHKFYRWNKYWNVMILNQMLQQYSMMILVP